MSDSHRQSSNAESSSTTVNKEGSSSVADKALAVVVVGAAALAIGYAIYRQKADRQKIIKIMDDRERQREEHAKKLDDGKPQALKNKNFSSLTTMTTERGEL